MERILKYLTTLVTILVVVCLCVVLILVWTMPDLPKSMTPINFCLPNELGDLNCGSAPYVLPGYLDRAIAKEYENIKREDEESQQKYLDENRVKLMSIYDRYFWEMKPAAKLTGKEQPSLRKSDIGKDMTPIREWRHGRELYDTYGFERYGVRYRNGRLVVPVSGTYYIYSFVDMFEPCDPATGKPNIEDSSQSIRHGIYRFNILDEEETELVTNVQPHVTSDNRYFNSYSSYVSSLAQLKAGDELSVKVSNLTFLRHTQNNYFGLNLI